MRVSLTLEPGAAWYVAEGSTPPIVVGRFPRNPSGMMNPSELAWREAHGYVGKSGCWDASPEHAPMLGRILGIEPGPSA